jgi:Uma2 family endonuclease
MGDRPTQEALVRQWCDIIADPALRELPYKIELNARGKIEMSPASNLHGYLQSLVATELKRLLPDGLVITEASVLTAIGVRVPDVVWASHAFVTAHGLVTPFPRAPEICVEVLSPTNTREEIDEKIAAYLAAGAIEVWVVAEDGRTCYYDATGERATSRFGVTPILPVPGGS